MAFESPWKIALRVFLITSNIALCYYYATVESSGSAFVAICWGVAAACHIASGAILMRQYLNVKKKNQVPDWVSKPYKVVMKIDDREELEDFISQHSVSSANSTSGEAVKVPMPKDVQTVRPKIKRMSP